MARLTNNEAAASGWTHRRTLTHEDFTAASTTQTFTQAIPAGSVVCNVGFYLETAFDGGATSTMVLDIGSADPDGFIDNVVVHEDGSEIFYAANNGLELIGDENTGSGRSLTVLVDDTIDMLFTASGANVSVLDTGKIHIWMDIRSLVPGGNDVS